MSLELEKELEEALALQSDLIARLSKANGVISVLVHLLSKEKGVPHVVA